MTENERLKWLQQQGSQASEMGWSHLDNPLLQTQYLPAASGLSVAEWELRHDAWHLGWALREAAKADQRVQQAVLTTDIGRYGNWARRIE